MSVRPETPFKGLAPFEDSELDARLFFGREREREVVAANLVAARLTVLYGSSGVGKTSLLRAAVVRYVRGLPEEPAVAFHNAWAEDDPERALAESVAAAADVEATGSLIETVEAAVVTCGELYLILDQLEEYFLYHGSGRDGGTMGDALPELVARRELPVHFLLGIREDSLARLDAFKARIPGLFSNSLRLDHLDLDAARRAIEGPVERFGELVPERAVTIEPELVDGVLDGVETGKLVQGSGGLGVVKGAEARRRVETPYLQLVMQRLWEAEREEDSHVLRHSTLQRLGGAGQIVEDHLERALAALEPAEKALAARMFHHLVTPSGTKIAHASSDLAEYSGASEADLARIVGTLARERILKPAAGDGASDKHEIYHDVLAGAVLAWRTGYEAESAIAVEREAARRRHRRLLLLVAAALVALAAMAGVTIFALSQRQHAKHQERAARAEGLSARALVQLDVDPEQSLEMALEAARLQPTPQAEVVLRRALLDARLRHVVHLGSPVTLVAYSPRGSEALVGRAEGGAALWDTRRRRILRTLDIGGGAIVAASFDRSGQSALTAQGPTAVVWDPSSGRRVAVIVHRGPVADAQFSGDGKRVVTASQDGTVRVSRARDGKRLRVLRMQGPAAKVALAGDGRTLVVIAANRAEHVQARLYRNGRLMRVLDARGVSDAEFSPDGRLVATSNYDGSTHLWSARTGKRLHTLDDDGGAVVDVDFSPDGTFLATGSSDGGVRVWRVATGDRFFYFTGHTSPVSHVVFDPTGTVLVSTSGDRSARLWQTAGIEAGRQLGLLIGHTEAVLAAAFAPDASTIVTGSADGTARIWDATVEERLVPVLQSRRPLVAAAVSSDGRFAVVGDPAGRVQVVPVGRRGSTVSMRMPSGVTDVAVARDRGVIAVAAGRVLQIWAPDGRQIAALGGSGPVARVRFSPNGRLLAVAVGRNVRLVRTGSSKPFATLPHSNEVTDVALSDDRVATGGKDGTVRIWDSHSGRLLHTLHGHEGAVARVAFSPDGTVLASGGADTTVRLWSGDGKPAGVLRGHSGPITDLAFDPSGAELVTTGAGSTENAMLWDVVTHRRMHDLVGHFGTVTHAGYSSDGRWIVTAGPISAVIWNAEAGRLLFYLRGHTDLLTSAAFLPGGYRVITSARDGSLRTFECGVCVPLDELMRLAEARVAIAR